MHELYVLIYILKIWRFIPMLDLWSREIFCSQQMAGELRPNVSYASINASRPLDPHPITLVKMHVTHGGCKRPLLVNKKSEYVDKRFVVSVYGPSDVTIVRLDGGWERVNPLGGCSKYPCGWIEAMALVQLSFVKDDYFVGGYQNFCGELGDKYNKIGITTSRGCWK